MKWNDIKIEDIKKISGVGGSSTKAYFVVTMKDGNEVKPDFPSFQEARKNCLDIKRAYNEFNNVPESYEIKSDTYIEVNKKSVHFGYNIHDNIGQSLYVTLLQAKELEMKGLLIDNGSRWLVYTCVGEIELGKVIRGRVDDNFITQIKALGYTFSIEKGMYSMGEKIEEVE